MSELPRTEDLPRTQDGYDAARVEEAFAAFAARVRDLEEVASELRDELRALRTSRSVPYDDEDWPDAYANGAPAPPPDWLASVPAPFERPFTVPRLALEAAFLLGVALLAGLADLSTASIVLVMAAAWALVALSEWSAAAKRARWRLDEVAPPLADGEADDETTGPWSMPVVEATAVTPADGSESRTVIAALPSAPEADEEPESSAEPEPESESESEPEPKPRRRLLPFRRRGRAEPAPEDPWET
jgi:hypothetical protein